MSTISSNKLSFDVLMLATHHIDIYTQYSIPIWKKYCEMHGYGFYNYQEQFLPDMAFTWSRLQMMLEHQKISKASHIVMVDADTFLYKKAMNLRMEDIVNKHMRPGKKILFQKDGSDRLGVYFSHNFKLSMKMKRWVLPNAGFNIMENSQEAREFLELWIELGRGRLSHLARVHPMTQNVLLHGVLQEPAMERMVGFLPSSLVSKRNTKFCKHLSAMSKERIAKEIKKEYDKIFEEDSAS